ncbi:hypothetical protein ACQ4PT_009038 [Festuca glaucescens]
MPSSSSWSPGASLDEPTFDRHLRTSADGSSTSRRSRARLRTPETLRAICRKYSIPDDFTPVIAGDRSPRAPPPGSVVVYADALEAGMRLPLHPFYVTVLSHYGIAPGQLMPNGWRALAGFVVLSHFTGVPPSLAVFRHFFSLCGFPHKHYSFSSNDAVGLLFRQLNNLKNPGWKEEYFFVSSSAPWPCPVQLGGGGGGHYRSSNFQQVLTRTEKAVATNLLRARGGSPIDLRMYLHESNMAKASIIRPPSPPPTPQGNGAHVYHITMEDFRAEKAAEAAAARASAGMVTVKSELVPDNNVPPCASSFGKKRKLAEDHANGESSSCGPSCPPGFAIPKKTSQRAAGDTSDWKVARQQLQTIVTPGREPELASSKPTDVITSSYTSVLKAVNEVVFSLGYALELEKKLRASEREADALRARERDAVEEANALRARERDAVEEADALRRELRKAKAELAETEMAKTAARGFSGSSREHARALAELELRGYERGMEDMKRAALRHYPHLDPSRLCRV